MVKGQQIKIKHLNDLNFIMMKTEQLSDASIVILLWRITQRMRERGEGESEKCMLNVEKMLHLTVHALERKVLKASPYSFVQQLSGFVQHINKVTMETFNRSPEETNFRVFVKAIDILMVKALVKYVTPQKSLGQLKVLTFNNLACILKHNKKYVRALKAVSFALEIEERLLKEKDTDERHNIVTTYLNKAAILSEMDRHEKAIEQIKKGQAIITSMEAKQPNLELLTGPDRSKAQERQNYLGYMKMIVFYNMAVENQHIGLQETAIKNYKKGLRTSVLIENDFMRAKFQAVLSNLGANN